MAGDNEDHRQPGADEHAETCAADGTTHCLRYAMPSGAQAWCHRQLVELRAVVREPKDHERAADQSDDDGVANATVPGSGFVQSIGVFPGAETRRKGAGAPARGVGGSWAFGRDGVAPWAVRLPRPSPGDHFDRGQTL